MTVRELIMRLQSFPMDSQAVFTFETDTKLSFPIEHVSYHPAEQTTVLE